MTDKQYGILPDDTVQWHGKITAKFMGYLDDKKKIKKFVTIHPVWREWVKADEWLKSHANYRMMNTRPVIGKWMFFYQNQKGITVDLISMPNYFMDGHTRWESCSQGRYCEDPETFTTMEHAERLIKRRLTRDNKK